MIKTTKTFSALLIIGFSCIFQVNQPMNAEIPEKVKQIFESHKLEIQAHFKSMKSFGLRSQPALLDRYYVKSDRTNRFKGAKKFKKIAEGLRIFTPNKYRLPLIENPKKPEDWITFSEKVEGKPLTHLTLERAQRLDELLKRGYWDIHPGNFIETENGTLYCIDTELQTRIFRHPLEMRSAIYNRMLNSIFGYNFSMENDARSYLEQQLNFTQKLLLRNQRIAKILDTSMRMIMYYGLLFMLKTI